MPGRASSPACSKWEPMDSNDVPLLQVNMASMQLETWPSPMQPEVGLHPNQLEGCSSSRFPSTHAHHGLVLPHQVEEGLLLCLEDHRQLQVGILCEREGPVLTMFLIHSELLGDNRCQQVRTAQPMCREEPAAWSTYMCIGGGRTLPSWLLHVSLCSLAVHPALEAVLDARAGGLRAKRAPLQIRPSALIFIKMRRCPLGQRVEEQGPRTPRDRCYAGWVNKLSRASVPCKNISLHDHQFRVRTLVLPPVLLRGTTWAYDTKDNMAALRVVVKVVVLPLYFWDP